MEKLKNQNHKNKSNTSRVYYFNGIVYHIKKGNYFMSENNNENTELQNTEQQNSEQQLYLRQKLDIIGQLAGGISHNFNNQLTGIVGFANLIRMRSQDANIKNYADEILGICKNFGDMVCELLTFARYKPSTTTGINIIEAANTITHLLSNGLNKNIEIKHHFLEGGIIQADPVQLQSALLNIALNSKDAMPKGGTITVTISRVEQITKPENLLAPLHDLWNAAAPGKCGFVKISAKDTGCGLDESETSHLFEPFFTTKGEGHVGLGLSAVYRFMQSLGGAIELTTKANEGTTVTLYLPCDGEVQKPEAAANAAPDVAVVKKDVSKNITTPKITSAVVTGTILLADDDNAIRDSLSAFLRDEGYSVLVASDGVDAVEKYNVANAAIDLVIIDVVMPRLDGKNAFLQMKEINKDVSAICITGYNKYTTEELMSIGIKKILHKPFQFEDLLSAIREFI